MHLGIVVPAGFPPGRILWVIVVAGVQMPLRLMTQLMRLRVC